MTSVERLRGWAGASATRNVTFTKNGPWYVSVEMTKPITFAGSFTHAELEVAAAEAIQKFLEAVGEQIPNQ